MLPNLIEFYKYPLPTRYRRVPQGLFTPDLHLVAVRNYEQDTAASEHRVELRFESLRASATKVTTSYAPRSGIPPRSARKLFDILLDEVTQSVEYSWNQFFGDRWQYRPIYLKPDMRAHHWERQAPTPPFAHNATLLLDQSDTSPPKDLHDYLPKTLLLLPPVLGKKVYVQAHYDAVPGRPDAAFTLRRFESLNALERLPPDARAIAKAEYGVDDGVRRCYTEIARVLKIPRQYAGVGDQFLRARFKVRQVRARRFR